MRRTILVATVLLAVAGVARAEEPKPGGPVPVPYPNVATTASSTSTRDAASGLPSGKRQHKPFVVTKEWDRKVLLADGRVFVVNSQTGEVVFGDGVQGRRPETSDVPKDGKYRTGGGAAGNVEIRAGRVVTPTPVPTRAAPKVK